MLLCLIIGTCASLNITGCCTVGSCFTGTCYCDKLCHYWGDCCPDNACFSSSYSTNSILTTSPTSTPFGK